jgi:hypothetical protein
VALVVRNWLLGRRIAEEELGGDTRLELYGRKVVPMLAKELTATYGKGYTRTSLYQYVQFYRMFPEIVHAASGQSHVLLTWTHYRELLDDRWIASCDAWVRKSFMEHLSRAAHFGRPLRCSR